MTDDMLAMRDRLAEKAELERLREEVKHWRALAADVGFLRQRVAQLERMNMPGPYASLRDMMTPRQNVVGDMNAAFPGLYSHPIWVS